MFNPYSMVLSNKKQFFYCRVLEHSSLSPEFVTLLSAISFIFYFTTKSLFYLFFTPHTLVVHMTNILKVGQNCKIAFRDSRTLLILFSVDCFVIYELGPPTSFSFRIYQKVNPQFLKGVRKIDISNFHERTTISKLCESIIFTISTFLKWFANMFHICTQIFGDILSKSFYIPWGRKL